MMGIQPEPETYFNPRSPRGERPTAVTSGLNRLLDFNPRSPRGERLEASSFVRNTIRISIHAPREGSD